MTSPKDADKDGSADVPAKHRTIWQRLTGNGGRSGPSLITKIVISAVVLAILMGVVFSLYASVPEGEDPGAAIDFPEEWNGVDPAWESIKAIDAAVDWIVINWDPFFSAINIVVLRILNPLQDFLMWLPWWLVIIIVGFLAWRAVSAKFAAIAVGFIAVMVVLGLTDLAMMTLAITITASLLCVVVGLPLGIIAANSDRIEGFLRPILDGMQTMPIFVYLIPAVMLFGLGKTPAVMATVIYAIPPIIRLTNLGIRQVAPSVIEAGKAFGATTWQMLRKVQIPLALPTILAGLNQTIMLALAMVVVASYIGAKGLGTEVLNGIARVEPGRGLIAGAAVIFLAIILDRVSQGFAKRPESRLAT